MTVDLIKLQKSQTLLIVGGENLLKICDQESGASMSIKHISDGYKIEGYIPPERAAEIILQAFNTIRT